MEKILITGINGFIGRNISDKILNNTKYKIIGCGRKEKPLSTMIDNYISCTLGEENFISKVLSIHNQLDTIIHLAASLNEDSNDITKTNCYGTLQLFDLAIKAKVKKIIFLSSIPVIGKPKEIPITETHTLNPLTKYHSSKIFGENILNLLKNYDKQVIILRIPSPIGIDMPNNKIFSVFVQNCIENKDIILKGMGKRIQNYIDVIDIWSAIEKSLLYTKSDLFNIASLTSYSNFELANICKKIIGSNNQIIFSDELDEEENNKWIIDPTKSKEKLGFVPNISIEESIINRKRFCENINR